MANINYEDKRFQEVEQEKEQALGNVDKTYGDMINQSDKFYQDQIDASNKYAEEQQKNQQENTDFLIEKTEQQKEQAHKDYLKEQRGAYADYKVQSDQYGANSEQMVANGLAGTGYSESSQVSMYNAYQNRVATAKESYNRAILNYDNAIKEAQLQNNSALADIAYKALQTQLEMSLQGFQYKNTLLQQQLAMKNQTEDRYYNRWQNVLQQMNTENALAEQIRQYNENLAFQKQQAQREQSNWEKQYNAQQEALRIQKDSGSGGSLYTEGSKKVGSAGKDAVKDVIKESGNSTDAYGNSALVQKKKDYYFSNGYQPQYVNDTKLSKSKYKVWNVFNEGTSDKNASSFGKQNIWQAGGKYYVWDGSIKDYVDVTSKVNNSVKNRINYEWGR